jgi:hypothetical protein
LDAEEVVRFVDKCFDKPIGLPFLSEFCFEKGSLDVAVVVRGTPPPEILKGDLIMVCYKSVFKVLV